MWIVPGQTRSTDRGDCNVSTLLKQFAVGSRIQLGQDVPARPATFGGHSTRFWPGRPHGQMIQPQKQRRHRHGFSHGTDPDRDCNFNSDSDSLALVWLKQRRASSQFQSLAATALERWAGHDQRDRRPRATTVINRDSAWNMRISLLVRSLVAPSYCYWGRPDFGERQEWMAPFNSMAGVNAATLFDVSTSV